MNKVAKSSDGTDYEWTAEKVSGGSGVVSADNRYAMVTDFDRAAIYLIGVIEDYDVNVEAGTAAKAGNRVQIHTLAVTRDRETGKKSCSLHGPLTFCFADGEVVSSFTAAFNANSAKSNGLAVAYTTPDGESPSAVTKMWRQNGSRGLVVSDVQIPDYLVKNNAPYIDLYLTVKNCGYGVEHLIPYVFRDENGVKLTEVVDDQDYEEYFHGGAVLYPGDVRVEHVRVRPNPGWKLNKEHEITADVTPSYRYDGDAGEVVNSAAVQAADISFSASNTLIGGKHYVSTTITNNTLVGVDSPVVQADFDYGGGSASKTMTFPLPMREQFAAMLQRYAKKQGLDVSKTAELSAYQDAADLSSWARDAMRWANAEGLILGRTETTLSPKGSAKRAEAAMILMRFIENGKEN